MITFSDKIKMNTFYDEIVLFGNCVATTTMPKSQPLLGKACKQEETKKEPTMGYLRADMDLTAQAKNYLLDRLNTAVYAKERDLQKTFGLSDDDEPRSFNEFLQRIEDGKFTYPEDRKDKKTGYWSVIEYIRWRDPDKKEDEEGYRKAQEAMNLAKTEARDTIFVKSEAEGLEALKAFESATFQ